MAKLYTTTSLTKSAARAKEEYEKHNGAPPGFPLPGECLRKEPEIEAAAVGRVRHQAETLQGARRKRTSDTESSSAESAIHAQHQNGSFWWCFWTRRKWPAQVAEVTENTTVTQKKAPSQEILASVPPAGVSLSEVSPRTAAADNVSGVSALGAQDNYQGYIGPDHRAMIQRAAPHAGRDTNLQLLPHAKRQCACAQATAPHAGRDVKFTGRPSYHIICINPFAYGADEQKHWIHTELVARGHGPFHTPSKNECGDIVEKGTRNHIWTNMDLPSPEHNTAAAATRTTEPAASQ